MFYSEFRGLLATILEDTFLMLNCSCKICRTDPLATFKIWNLHGYSNSIKLWHSKPHVRDLHDHFTLVVRENRSLLRIKTLPFFQLGAGTWYMVMSGMGACMRVISLLKKINVDKLEYYKKWNMLFCHNP